LDDLDDPEKHYQIQANPSKMSQAGMG